MADDLFDPNALIRYVERIEQFAAQRVDINAEIRVIYDQIKESGMDPATVRQMVRERALKPDTRADQYRLRNQYRVALGLFSETPLGQAADYTDSIKEELQVTATGPVEVWPKPFAQQTVHQPRRPRGRPPKPRLHLFEPDPQPPAAA